MNIDKAWKHRNITWKFNNNWQNLLYSY